MCVGAHKRAYVHVQVLVDQGFQWSTLAAKGAPFQAVAKTDVNIQGRPVSGYQKW